VVLALQQQQCYQCSCMPWGIPDLHQPQTSCFASLHCNGAFMQTAAEHCSCLRCSFFIDGLLHGCAAAAAVAAVCVSPPILMCFMASGLTSGMTRGTPSVMRKAEELSTT